MNASPTMQQDVLRTALRWIGMGAILQCSLALGLQPKAWAVDGRMGDSPSAPLQIQDANGGAQPLTGSGSAPVAASPASATAAAGSPAMSALPEYVVTSTGISQAAAFDQMHASINKVNVLSKDQIDQTPAMTIGEAVQELPGVGVQHDEGEPIFMEIRGMDENFNIITFDGTNIPSYEPSLRAVAVDDIPSGIVSNMEVYKTLLPDMEAEGVGGQLNLVPQSAFNYPGGQLLEITAAGGYAPENDQPEFQGSLTYADTFKLGGQAKLGLLFTSMADQKEYAIEDIEETYSGPAGVADALSPKSVDQYSLRDEDYERLRAGLGLNIDLSVDPGDQYFGRILYGGYNEIRDPKEVTDYNDLDVLASEGDTVNPDGSFTVNEDGSKNDIEKELTNVFTENRTLAMDAGGQNDLSGRMKGLSVDYKASYADANSDEPIDDSYKFESFANAITGSITYNNSANNGNSPVINTSQLGGENNGNNYFLKEEENGPSVDDTQEFSLQANFKLQTDNFFGADDTGLLQYGAKARMSYTTYSQVSWEDDENKSNPLLLSDVQAGDLMTNPTYYPGNVYDLGPTISLSQIQGTNLSPYTTGWYQSDPIGDLGADYNSEERIYALYAMYTATMDKLQLMAGARMEVTSITYNWNSAYDSNGNELSAATPMTGYDNYVNILPALGLKYDFDPKFQTRLNFSETVARPTYAQYIPAAGQGGYVPGTDPDPQTANEFGNANIQPMLSYNVDSSWEYYFQKGAILGLDGFFKEINNYFETNYNLVDAGGPNGTQGIVTFSNIPWSQVYGVEGQYQQQFTMLPGAWSGLGLRGSISGINSAGELTPGDPNSVGQLPSQSNLIWNAGVFYKKYHWTLDVAGSFTGANLFEVGDQVRGIPNVYYDNYFQIDAKVQYAVSKNLTLYVSGNNLNDAPLRFYQSNPNYPLQDEFYGPSADGGVKIDF